jgi:uncharacterized protein
MEIPGYPASRPLLLDDKPLLDGIFANLQPRISEFSFADLYLFRQAHAYRLTVVEGSLVLLGRGYGGEEYFLPPLTGGVAEALARLFDAGLSLYGADETFVNSFLRDKEISIVADRDNFDYLYLRRDLAELHGNRYHKKKNRINYFASRHEYRIEPYGPGYLDGCLELLAKWRRVRAEIESRSLLLEADATEEALHMVVPLGLEGLVAIVDGEVKGFVLGGRLNSDTSVCHFEKADPYLEGLYQLINREFCRLLFTDCTHVNREQDLGEPSLRASKLSYHPVELVKKYRVHP